jgi:biotin carboxylase
VGTAEGVKQATHLLVSVGAGTVEFIMDATTDEYFFMEM